MASPSSDDRRRLSNERAKRWQAEHREQHLATKKAYRMKNADGLKSKWSQWYEANKERHLAGRRAYYRANRDQIMANTLDRQRKRKYGLSQSDVEFIVGEIQGGECPICDCEIDPKTAHVDHDHETGDVRGVLCNNCNLGIGHFKDDPKRLQEAVLYLAAGNQR